MFTAAIAICMYRNYSNQNVVRDVTMLCTRHSDVNKISNATVNLNEVAKLMILFQIFGTFQRFKVIKNNCNISVRYGKEKLW